VHHLSSDKVCHIMAGDDGGTACSSKYHMERQEGVELGQSRLRLLSQPFPGNYQGSYENELNPSSRAVP
jgi:hypothetical protein